MQQTSSRVLLAPRLIQPCVISGNNIEFRFVNNPDYLDAQQSIALSKLLAVGIMRYDTTLHKKNCPLYMIAPPNLCFDAYLKEIEQIVNGIHLCADRSFEQRANNQPAPAELWLDFTHAKEKRNAVFLTFSQQTCTKLIRVLSYLAEKASI